MPWRGLGDTTAGRGGGGFRQDSAGGCEERESAYRECLLVCPGELVVRRTQVSLMFRSPRYDGASFAGMLLARRASPACSNTHTSSFKYMHWSRSFGFFVPLGALRQLSKPNSIKTTHTRRSHFLVSALQTKVEINTVSYCISI